MVGKELKRHILPGHAPANGRARLFPAAMLSELKDIASIADLANRLHHLCVCHSAHLVLHIHSLVRGTDAEIVSVPTARVRPLADSGATGGALSTVRVTLSKGADAARPHRHERAAEMFYVLGGVVQVLSGKEIVRAEEGDMIVVPPRMPHAISAERDHSAELLVVIAPGIERFESFRQLMRIARGEEPPESLADVQKLYDTYFLSSPEWDIERSGE